MQWVVNRNGPGNDVEVDKYSVGIWKARTFKNDNRGVGRNSIEMVLVVAHQKLDIHDERFEELQLYCVSEGAADKTVISPAFRGLLGDQVGEDLPPDF